MCDSDYSGDEECSYPSQIYPRGYELKPLSFIGYEMCGNSKQLELGVPLTDLDLTKLSVVRDNFNPSNFNVLYDGNKLRVFLKAFPTIMKRSKFYERKKYIKIKDKCISEIWWQTCWKIAQLLMKEVASENKFCWFVEWYKIWIKFCDYRFLPKRLYHFEESSVAIDKIVLMEEKEWHH